MTKFENIQRKYTREYIEDLYYNKKLTKTKIAQKCKLSAWMINKLFEYYNIQCRSYSEAARLQPKQLLKHYGHDLDTKDGLEKIYNKYSCSQICKKFNINAQLLYRRLKKFNIPTKLKPHQRITKNELKNLYYNKKMSQAKIAQAYNVSKYTITKLFKLYRLKGRTFSEASKLRSKIISSQMQKQWADPKYIAKMSNGYDSIKQKMAHMSRRQLSRVSSTQKILYSILDDLGIPYESEKTIGWWIYDCYLPKHNIIIECQDDYWHSLKKTKIRDKAKATYLEEYYPHIQLKHIWEHEFLCRDRVTELIKYWTKIYKFQQIDFNLKDVNINIISDNSAKLFIAKYHYYGKIGKNSTKFGAYIDNKLIAVCCFASITRNETATRLEVIRNARINQILYTSIISKEEFQHMVNI